MVDALVSGASVERRAGSSPVLGTVKATYQGGHHQVKSLLLFSTGKLQAKFGSADFPGGQTVSQE